MLRSLTVRIIVAVLGTLLLSLVAFVGTFLAMSGPANVRLIREFQAYQIDQGVRVLNERGPGEAARFLDELNRSRGATHYLTDADGRDLVTGADRSALLHAPRPWFGPPSIDGRLVVVEPSRDGRYRLIILAAPPFDISAFVPYYLLILVAVACLSWLIAIGIVRPVREVARAVSQFGQGELTRRVQVTRPDEIGDLGRSFNDMAGRIQTLLTAERRLLQDISHELRSPLARLNIAIELARNAEDRELAIGRLQREADRLAALVSSLLDVTRIEGDPGAQRAEAVSPGDIVDTVTGECELEANARQCRIVVQKRTDQMIEGYPELLRRAVENVVRNAIRYAPAHTDVVVETEDTADGVAITVRDHGPGVSDADIPRLIQPFFRVDRARDVAAGGVGLGLSIAHRSVVLHHGSMEIENADPGLRVRLILPSRPSSYQAVS